MPELKDFGKVYHNDKINISKLNYFTTMKFLKNIIGKDWRLPQFIENFFGTKISDQVGKDEELITLPSVNIADEDAAFDLKVALPGLSKNDIKIEIKDNNLIISSEKSNKTEEKGKNWIRQEFSYASFYRVFALPDNADPNKVEAKMENGLLSLKVAKKYDKKETKKLIAIK